VTQAQRSEYAQAVWDAFLEHSGSTRLMASPLEFDLIRRWMDEVPLRVVLRGIWDCTGRGKTLAYYSDPVREAAQHWHEATA